MRSAISIRCNARWKRNRGGGLCPDDVSRLTLAFGPEGARLPDDGQIAVFRPRTGYDLTVLPKTRVKVVQGFFPDHQSFFDAGYAVTPATEETFAAAVIALPRVKAEARALVFQAAALVPPGGLIVIDGNKTDGIESLLNDVRRRVDIAGSFPKAHGRVFWFAAEPVFDDWAPKPLLVEGGFQTVPGIFSSDATGSRKRNSGGKSSPTPSWAGMRSGCRLGLSGAGGPCTHRRRRVASDRSRARGACMRPAERD